ncbi:alpha-mannosidase [Microbacterium sp. VKM Ac-2923]|uniref:alpha-mannosidase n=1 Tax=Microbacterium sp. VKM Ac-2923 TaxID=2929476 RepID=UPI001FB3FB87|nr:alpha-mannosidase [Microbacterium sp. VKM Ac-2923]MCJ1708760.1 glycosyl hydrolase-related protein [Microbacterium sp. VKM Ac-2923]
MHDHLRTTLERLVRVQRDRIETQVHRTVAEVDLSSWEVGDDGEPVSPAHAVGFAADEGRAVAHYEPFEVGQPWGQAWVTRWFRVEGAIPAGAGESVELILDLGWFDHSVGGHCEALIFTPDGVPVKGLHPRQRWVRLRGDGARPGVVDADGRFLLYIEAAANPLLLGVPPFLVTPHGEKGVEGFEEFRVRQAAVASFHSEVYEFSRDLDVAGELAATVRSEDPRHWRLLRGIEEALDVYDERRPDETAREGRRILAPLLASPAHASAHRVTAVGHAHMDSAWLWPLRETVRKLARTVSNALALLDTDPDVVYTMTSAQHFAWLEEHYPALFERVRTYVEQGRFIPVGGMWVEVDGVIPTGESFVRQIVHGKRYFADRFGLDSREVWLPDSFGYSGALPQLARRSGSDVFLTQKISWNDTTVFPHHSFWWEGIDGTRVFTHFPPSDTYAASVTGQELAHSVANFKDKAIASHSLLAYGYGDGGGGPTREMASRVRRFADIEGAPRVASRTPDEFFRDAAAELADVAPTSAPAPVWAGELYLELHRGSLTSQQRMKSGNRRMEGLLREIEAAWSAAAVLTGAEYPADVLDAIWKNVLLHQFHDILPGTSIAWVHREARDFYEETEHTLLGLLAAAGDALREAGATTPPTLIAPEATRVHEGTDGIVLDNGVLTVRFDAAGHIVSVRTAEGRESVADGALLGQLILFRDEPVRWDAWDLDRHVLRHPRAITDTRSIETVVDGGDVGVRVIRVFGDSRATLTSWLRAGGSRVETEAVIDWREREQLLKVSLPLAARARTARFETQYGSVERPLHTNTAADEAMFEASLQRYVHVAEGTTGDAVLSSGIAGADARVEAAGTTVRLSLLRGARFPDPDADIGVHTLSWAIAPDVDIAGAVDSARHFATPSEADAGIPRLATLDLESGHAVIDWVKLAEDRSGDVIVRAYETSGARARARLEVHPSLRDRLISEVDLLERPAPVDGPRHALRHGPSQTASDAFLDLGPYQVATVRLRPSLPATPHSTTT